VRPCAGRGCQEMFVRSEKKRERMRRKGGKEREERTID
jgi:hypothetical protein